MGLFEAYLGVVNWGAGSVIGDETEEVEMSRRVEGWVAAVAVARGSIRVFASGWRRF